MVSLAEEAVPILVKYSKMPKDTINQWKIFTNTLKADIYGLALIKQQIWIKYKGYDVDADIYFYFTDGSIACLSGTEVIVL